MHQTAIDSKDDILSRIDVESDMEAIHQTAKIANFLELASGFFNELHYNYKAVEVAERSLKRLATIDCPPIDLDPLRRTLALQRDAYFEAQQKDMATPRKSVDYKDIATGIALNVATLAYVRCKDSPNPNWMQVEKDYIDYVASVIRKSVEGDCGTPREQIYDGSDCDCGSPPDNQCRACLGTGKVY